MGFNFPFPENGEQVRMQPHFRQTANIDLGMLLLLLSRDIEDLFN
jgi:hypothetical protein